MYCFCLWVMASSWVVDGVGPVAVASTLEEGVEFGNSQPEGSQVSLIFSIYYYFKNCCWANCIHYILVFLSARVCSLLIDSIHFVFDVGHNIKE